MIDTSQIKIEKSFRKTMSLHILPNGSLVVRAPVFVSSHAIHQFIEKNEEWIQKKLKKVEARPKTIKHKYKNGEQFMYLGNSYTLAIGPYASIAVKDSQFLFPQGIEFRIQKEITDWYIKQARKVITERIRMNAEEMKVEYGTIMFSDTKSKWGSCSPENNLQFNWRLIMAPILVLNYVVIHELAHTIQKNHSTNFWSVVEKYNPSYRQQRKWLKTFGDTLML